MKKLIYSGASLALVSALTLIPVTSFAQINVNSSTTGSININAHGNATSSDAMIEIGAEVGIGDDTSTTSTSTTEDMEDTNDEGNLSLRLNANGVAITSASEVNTEADLEVFAHNVTATEETVDEADAEVTAEGQSRVEVVYKHYGELFGVIPVVIKSTTVVTTGNGEVEVDSNLPWWSFMATKKTHAANEIEARIKDNPTVMMSAEMEANAAIQAQIMEAVVAELNAHTSLHTSLNG
jgi:hypothetical protein